MSTIAYREGIIAGDTICIRNDTKHFFRTKIARAPDGTLGGAVGTLIFCVQFLDWVQGKRSDPPECKSDQHYSDLGIVIHPNGDIELFEPLGCAIVTAPYVAIGSGADIALGAMYAGAPASIAVAAAIKFDTFTGGKIDILQRDQSHKRTVDASELL